MTWKERRWIKRSSACKHDSSWAPNSWIIRAAGKLCWKAARDWASGSEASRQKRSPKAHKVIGSGWPARGDRHRGISTG